MWREAFKLWMEKNNSSDAISQVVTLERGEMERRVKTQNIVRKKEREPQIIKLYS